MSHLELAQLLNDPRETIIARAGSLWYLQPFRTGHAPSLLMSTFAQYATQSLPYVARSPPQTGALVFGVLEQLQPENMIPKIPFRIGCLLFSR